MRAPTCCGIGRVGLDGLGRRCFQRAIDDGHVARLAVQLEEDGPRAVGVRLADRQELDDQRLARLDVDRDLLARSPGRRRRRASAARWCRSSSARGPRSPDRPWDRAGTRARRARFGSRLIMLRDLRGRRGEVGRRQARAGAALERLAVAEDALLQSAAESRPAAGPSCPASRSMTDSGNASSRSPSSTSSAVRLLATRNRAMSPTALRGRRHLDDVAEQLVRPRRTSGRPPCQRAARPRAWACW